MALQEMQKAVNVKDDCGETPLSLFVKLRWLEGVCMLLEAGRVDPNEKALGGIPPLISALSVPVDSDIVQVLLKHRANPNLPVMHPPPYSQPLELAIKLRHKAALRALVAAKADVTHSLLSCAVGNRVDIIKEMLKYKASVQSRDSMGRTPLHIAACSSTDDAVVELIRAKADIDAWDSLGWSPEMHYTRENVLTPWQDLVDRGVGEFFGECVAALAHPDDEASYDDADPDDGADGPKAGRGRPQQQDDDNSVERVSTYTDIESLEQAVLVD